MPRPVRVQEKEGITGQGDRLQRGTCYSALGMWRYMDCMPTLPGR